MGFVHRAYFLIHTVFPGRGDFDLRRVGEVRSEVQSTAIL